MRWWRNNLKGSRKNSNNSEITCRMPRNWDYIWTSISRASQSDLITTTFLPKMLKGPICNSHLIVFGIRDCLMLCYSNDFRILIIITSFKLSYICKIGKIFMRNWTPSMLKLAYRLKASWRMTLDWRDKTRAEAW